MERCFGRGNHTKLSATANRSLGCFGARKLMVLTRYASITAVVLCRSTEVSPGKKKGDGGTGDCEAGIPKAVDHQASGRTWWKSDRHKSVAATDCEGASVRVAQPPIDSCCWLCDAGTFHREHARVKVPSMWISGGQGLVSNKRRTLQRHAERQDRATPEMLRNRAE